MNITRMTHLLFVCHLIRKFSERYCDRNYSIVIVYYWRCGCEYIFVVINFVHIICHFNGKMKNNNILEEFKYIYIFSTNVIMTSNKDLRMSTTCRKWRINVLFSKEIRRNLLINWVRDFHIFNYTVMTRTVVSRYPIGFLAKLKHDFSEIIDDDSTISSAQMKK